jgi:hypothetical protein
MAQYGLAKAVKNREKQQRADHKKAKENDKYRLKELRRRAKWYSNLEILVNQYVRYRDRNEPCCTCGTTRPIKYDAGHFHTKAARPDIRFELTNIHKQCSVNCNQHGSGMRAEYTDFITAKYGVDHLAWLNSPHKTLKEVFPTWHDIEDEIIRYRKILRECGIKPNY